MHKYIGRVFNADTGECVELVPVMASGHSHARRLVLGNVDTTDGQFVDVKKFHEPRQIKAPQYGV